MDTAQPSVLVLEPYATGSHAAWLAGLAASSRWQVSTATLPGRFWKWRMHGAAATFARQLTQQDALPAAVLATDMLDVATFLGLTRDRLAGVPLAVYFHENQLTYPAPEREPGWTADRWRRARRRDEHYGWINLTSALAADAVLWNSMHNRDSFLDRLPEFLKSFPDHRLPDAADLIAAKSEVLPVGLDLAALNRARPAERCAGPLRILWNHRWEHDKDPDTFFAALDLLAARGLAFEVVLLGESFVRAPTVFDAARDRLGDRVRHWGFVADRDEYRRWLWQCDVVVSTARHEFFGLAVAEAIACGCLPVLPDRLAYPELIPPAWHPQLLYSTFEGLVARLAEAIVAPSVPAQLLADLQVRMAELDWSMVAPRYDEVLDRLVDQAARRGTRAAQQATGEA